MTWAVTLIDQYGVTWTRDDETSQTEEQAVDALVRHLQATNCIDDGPYKASAIWRLLP